MPDAVLTGTVYRSPPLKPQKEIALGAASLLFQWRKAYADGSLMVVAVNEAVVPASEMKEVLKRIQQLEVVLGRKTLEDEILKESVDYGKSTVRPSTDQHTHLLRKDIVFYLIFVFLKNL